MNPTVEQMSVSVSAGLREAMRVLESTAQGLCFVVDARARLVGTLSDGDIRRHLLRQGSIDNEVGMAMNAVPIRLRAGASVGELQSTLGDRIRIVPIVDEMDRVVDYANARRFHQVPVLEPSFRGNELEYVTDCVKSGWVSSQGTYVTRFERTVAEYVGANQALAVCNGTVALHLALKVLGIGSGGEVIVPDFTFAASINAILYTGATPVIVDVSHDTWTLCPKLVQKAITDKTRAIMPVHIYGHPCHMDEIMEIARAHRLLVVEDCAEALGSYYKSKRLGTHGDAAAFSFFGNKVITTGEGGMIVFRDPAVHDRARILRDHGMNPNRKYWHDAVGYNYRMTNLQAALGVAQMEQIDGFLSRRAEIAKKYSAGLRSSPHITLQPIQPWAKSNNWLYTVLIDDQCEILRDELVKRLAKNGIETRPTFCSLHRMELYAQFARAGHYPVSRMLMERGLSLPSSVNLTDGEVEFVVRNLLDQLSFQDLKKAASHKWYANLS